MPSFTIINDTDDLKGFREAGWTDNIEKFKSKNHIVNAAGQKWEEIAKTQTTYAGHWYRLTTKLERKFLWHEQAKRIVQGTLLVIASLGRGLWSSSVRKLFTASKEQRRFGIRIDNFDERQTWLVW